MSNLMVTGGAGFIGTNFVYHWLVENPGDSVIVLDALTYAGNRQNLAALGGESRFSFHHGDIRDQALVEELLKKHAVGILVHFAAESHVDRSITGPDAFLDANITGTHSLLKAARSTWLESDTPHRFHHVSTDEVYGSLEANDPAFTETTPYAPNSPYAASKAASDHLVRAYHHTYGLNVTTSNCSNNYGPYHFPEKLIPLCIANILDGKPLPIYGDGLNIRDWLYVSDHCRGIEQVIKSGRAGETYNIGGDNEWANIDIVKLLCKMLDDAFSNDSTLAGRFAQCPAAKGVACESLITFVKDRPGHDRRYAIDAEKISRELNFRPVETFETGIVKTVRWYLDNESWWRSVMDGSYRQWIDSQYSA